MSLLSKVKFNYWSLLPVLFGTILILLLLNNSLQFDFFSFKLHHKAVHNIATYLLILSSGLFLFFSEHWRNQTPHKKLLVFSLILFFASLFFKVSQVFQFSFLFAISALYFYSKEKKFYRPNLFYIALFFYFVTEIASLLWSLNKAEGFIYAGNISPIAFIPLLFCLFKLDKGDLETITTTVFRVSMVFVFFSIITWILQSRNINFPLENSLTFKKQAIGTHFCYDVIFAWSNYEHPTYMALNLIFSISIGWFYLLKKNIENNITLIELGFICVSVLLLASLTASRFMLISWLAINALGLLYTLRNKKIVLTICVVFIILSSGVFLYKFSDKVIGFFNDPARETLHKAASLAISENTWHGTGLGGMTRYIYAESPVFAPLQIPKSEFTHIHPHNQFIGDLMQTGIFGIMTLSFILLAMFYLCFKQRNWLLLMNCILFLLLMNIEMPLIYKKGVFAFVLTLSLLTNRGKTD